jgi:hypothetical protein
MKQATKDETVSGRQGFFYQPKHDCVVGDCPTRRLGVRQLAAAFASKITAHQRKQQCNPAKAQASLRTPRRRCAPRTSKGNRPHMKEKYAVLGEMLPPWLDAHVPRGVQDFGPG